MQGYPWWPSMCSRTAADNGKSCNPPGAVSAAGTGNCSGLPVDNKVDLVTVDNPKNAPAFFTYQYCASHTGVPNINTFSSVDITNPDSAGFSSYFQNDLSLQPSSPVFKARPKLLSCPRQYVGVQKFSLGSFFWNFNIPEPAAYQTMITMNTSSIHDMAIVNSLWK